jgi:hypothetical protein
MPTRRAFLKTSAGAGWVLGCGASLGIDSLIPVAQADAEVTPDLVRFSPDIEPLVRLVEETPREKCFDMMVDQLHRGLPYRSFLAALFLAGIRNVNPQPPGFKFHCVLAMHSANQLSLDAVPGDRLLPLFWALDQFKKSQAEDIQKGDFRMTNLIGSLPSPEKSAAEFHDAMQAWDQERASRAVAAFARSHGADEVIEAFWRYGARDFRAIGHKGIFVANSWRTLQTIGWRHAEPVLRSLVLAVLDGGQKSTANHSSDDPAYRSNVERARKALPSLPGGWTGAASDEAATRDLLDAMRTADAETACQKVLDELQSGKIQAQAAWDAVHLAAGELMMRQPGIRGIHTVTSANSLHYAFRTASNPETRLLMLLHAVAWMEQFRSMMARGGKMGSIKITELQPESVADDDLKGAQDVFALVGKNNVEAANRAFAFASRHPQSAAYPQLARQLIFRKGTDAHHYKYAAAIFEDYELVSPKWQPHMLATSVYYLRGTNESDSKVMDRAVEALKRV